MRLVGLVGYGRTGKDEVGRILDAEGWTRFAKGDLIKKAAYRMNPFVWVDGGPWQERSLHRLRNVVDEVGWEATKDRSDDARRFLQDLPDETVEVLGRDVWNDALFRAIDLHARVDPGEGVYLARVCHPYEVEPIRERGGALIRVDRPGYGPVNDSTNETALDSAEYDGYIVNGGTLQDLRERTLNLVAALYPKERR